MNPIKTKFEDQPQTSDHPHFAGGLMLSRSNPIWLPAAILKKSIWRHNSAKGCSILTKYGRPMQNDTPMTKIR